MSNDKEEILSEFERKIREGQVAFDAQLMAASDRACEEQLYGGKRKICPDNDEGHCKFYNKDCMGALCSKFNITTPTIHLLGQELKALWRDGSSQVEDPENWRKWLGKILKRYEDDLV